MGLLPPSGQQDDRHARLAANASDNLKSVKPGKHHVDQRHVDPAATQQRQPIQAVVSLEHRVALPLQVETQQTPERVLVIDHQNTCSRPHSGDCSTALLTRCQQLAVP